MVLNPDFRSFLESLAKHDVRYLLVGGYSVAIHGSPRYTKDLDLWIFADPSNAERLIRAIEDFGFGSLHLSAADFVIPGYVIQLGQAPARIDLLTSLEGVEFEGCWRRRLTIDVDGLALPVISLPDLRANKRALGRHRDLADLDDLADG